MRKTRISSTPNIFFWLRPAIYALVLLCVAFICSFQLTSDNEREYKLKAAFIFNFIQYIDWSVTSPKEYTIGIVGECPIEQDLREIAQTKTANNKKITILRFNNNEDIIGCNILFIPRDASGSLESILSRTAKGTLVVSEKPGCGRKGAAINFVIIDNKLKFETNLKAISSAGLKASSQLLKLAIIIDGESNGKIQ